MKDLKIYYIYHSCFAIETSKHLMVFDYFKTPEKDKKDDIDLIKLVSESRKKVFIFASHSHHDHFNPEILTWKNLYSSLSYVLSDDIILPKPLENCHMLHEGETLNLGDLQVEAFGSSDLGVSFLISTEGFNIFHAGDLNWWYWKDDTPEEEKYMRELYQGIIEKIGPNRNIDIAFFPVDPRLEEFCYLGGEYFAEHVHPKVIIPMHFDKNFNVTEIFKKKIASFGVKGITFHRENMLLNLD